MITGGSGSFGNHLVDYLQRHHPPKKLIIFSRDELKQFEMAKIHNEPNIRYFLGDVRDAGRLRRACHGVDVIVHAAALKQVPAAEYNPFEAIKTNVLGAQNIIDAAIEEGVKRVLALSTDKAVNPINLYGATKLCADKIFVAGNAYANNRTLFSVVRYGNVIGSRGSVVPLFMEKRSTGVLPITDEKMTRFWITLEQSILFVLECIRMMKGGEVFIPKIPSMRVVDLARAIAPECQLKFIGIRPGEKLHEMLICEDDARNILEFDNFFLIKPDFEWWESEEWPGGKPVADDFSYKSDTNTDWLDTEQISRLLKLN